MLDAVTLRSLSVARLEEARILYQNGRHDVAAYICGYAIELALKARICDTLNLSDYPDDLQSFKTHELNRLLRLSGREISLKQNYLAEWNIVQWWKPEVRYQQVGRVSPADAQVFIQTVSILLQQI